MSAVSPVTSDFSYSADSGHRAPSLPINTSPEVSPVGCFVPTVKNDENFTLERKKSSCYMSSLRGRRLKGKGRERES